MENGKAFKTKTGWCHVLPDKIVLTREGLIGGITNLTHENNVARLRPVYIVVVCCFFYIAINSFMQSGITLPFVTMVLVAVYFLLGIVRSAHISITPIIFREKIVSVKLKAGFMRPRFEILFENEKGRLQKRLIPLSGAVMGKKSETEHAVHIMKEEGLLL